MKNSGFGEIFNERKREKLNLSLLKEKKVILNPVYNWVQDYNIDIESLKDKEVCLCSIFKYLSPPVLPKGDKKSQFIFVTDPPDDVEGEEGEKFFSETDVGYLFDSMLDILNLKRDNVYITSYVFCRDEKRGVNSQHALNCARLHKKEFKELTNMEYVFTLGTRPFQLMSGIFGGMSAYVGSYISSEIFGKQVSIIPLNSPVFLLDSEEVRRKNFEVLEKLKT